MLPARPPPDLDLIAVLIVVSTALFGRPAVAEIVGPYLVILTCALAGAAYSASGRESVGRWRTFGYIVGVTFVAVVITVPISELISRHVGVPPRWIMGCIAGGIGIVGADLPRLVQQGFRMGTDRLVPWAIGLLPWSRKDTPK